MSNPPRHPRDSRHVGHTTSRRGTWRGLPLARPGSAIILIIVSLTLMILIGATYLQLVRSQRLPLHLHDETTALPDVQGQIVDQMRNLGERDLFDDGDFEFQLFDYPWAGEPSGWIEIELPGEVTIDVARRHGNPLLASPLPEFPDPTNPHLAYWPQITDLNGYYLDFDRETNRFALNSDTGLPEPLVVDDLQDPDTSSAWQIIDQDDSTSDNLQLVDATGDGVPDSRWTWAPTPQVNGVYYVMAVRFVDLSSKINVNTASSLINASGDYVSGHAPRWDTPAELDLGRFIRRLDPDAMAAGDEVAQMLRHRLGTPSLPTPYGTGNDRRRRYWNDQGRYLDRQAALPRQFSMLDEYELRHREGLNHPDRPHPVHHINADPNRLDLFWWDEPDAPGPGLAMFLRARQYPNAPDVPEPVLEQTWQDVAEALYDDAHFTTDQFDENHIGSLRSYYGFHPQFAMVEPLLFEPRKHLTTRSGAVPYRMPLLLSPDAEPADPGQHDRPVEFRGELRHDINADTFDAAELANLLWDIYRPDRTDPDAVNPDPDLAQPAAYLPGGFDPRDGAEVAAFALQMGLNIETYRQTPNDNRVRWFDIVYEENETSSLSEELLYHLGQRENAANDPIPEYYAMHPLPVIGEVYAQRLYRPGAGDPTPRYDDPSPPPDAIPDFWTIEWTSNPDDEAGYAIEIRNPYDRPVSLENVFIFFAPDPAIERNSEFDPLATLDWDDTAQEGVALGNVDVLVRIAQREQIDAGSPPPGDDQFHYAGPAWQGELGPGQTLVLYRRSTTGGSPGSGSTHPDRFGDHVNADFIARLPEAEPTDADYDDVLTDDPSDPHRVPRPESDWPADWRDWGIVDPDDPPSAEWGDWPKLGDPSSPQWAVNGGDDRRYFRVELRAMREIRNVEHDGDNPADHVLRWAYSRSAAVALPDFSFVQQFDTPSDFDWDEEDTWPDPAEPGYWQESVQASTDGVNSLLTRWEDYGIKDRLPDGLYDGDADPPEPTDDHESNFHDLGSENKDEEPGNNRRPLDSDENQITIRGKDLDHPGELLHVSVLAPMPFDVKLAATDETLPLVSDGWLHVVDRFAALYTNVQTSQTESGGPSGYGGSRFGAVDYGTRLLMLGYDPYPDDWDVLSGAGTIYLQPGTPAGHDPTLDAYVIPHAVLLLDQFTTLSPADNSNIIPGTLNINTAAPEVLEASLPIADEQLRREIVRRIVAYRGGPWLNSFLEPDPVEPSIAFRHYEEGISLDQALGELQERRGKLLGDSSTFAEYVPYVRRQPGFATTAELYWLLADLLVTDNLTDDHTGATDYSSDDINTIDGIAVHPRDFANDDVENDRNEETLLGRWIAQVTTTRSDVFAAYIVIRGYYSEEEMVRRYGEELRGHTGFGPTNGAPNPRPIPPHLGMHESRRIIGIFQRETDGEGNIRMRLIPYANDEPMRVRRSPQ
ncbi:MAG: hypothetical protein WD009_04465 [Phycisphaeraceae bacterium]